MTIERCVPFTETGNWQSASAGTGYKTSVVRSPQRRLISMNTTLKRCDRTGLLATTCWAHWITI